MPSSASVASSRYASSFRSTIHQEEAKRPWDSDMELKKVSRTLLRLQKYALILGMVATNATLIWASIYYTDHYYLFLPFLSANTFLQASFALGIIVSVTSTWIYRRVCNIKDEEPVSPEKFVMVLPCYNEDRNEIETSLDSLIHQEKIDKHPRMIMVIVDGNAKAPGETKTTQDFLLNDIFQNGQRTVFENGYCARDGLFMAVTIQEGIYKGVPYVMIGKRYNQGKRDSLCFVRSFLYHYRNRSQNLPTMFNPDLFDYLGSVLTNNGLDTVDYLCGMDGDTVFEKDCVWELIKSMRRGGPNVKGVCGAVCVKFDEHPWGLW